VAFEGDLQNIHLADIFQSLSTNRQIGTLVVTSDDREKRFAFGKHGIATISRRSKSGSRLGEFLIGRGLLSEENLKDALAAQRQAGHPLGRVLVENEIVDPQHVEEILRYHAAEEIYEVFEWLTGRFTFEEGETAAGPGEGSPFADIFFSPDGLVLEAARRLDELGLIKQVFPSSRDFLIRARPLEEGETLEHDAVQLLSLVDGARDIDALASAFYLSRFDLMSILRHLLEAGLIRKRDRDDLVQGARLLIETDEVLRATRMLERALELSGESPEILQALVDACKSSGDGTAAASWLIRLAGNHVKTDQGAAAAECAREALRIDERNLEATEILGDIALKSGQPAEAVELACRRVSILREKREFEAGILVCEQILEIPHCESLEIRVHLGCCQAAIRRTEGAVTSFKAAATMAEQQGRVRDLTDILRRILTLEPENEAAQSRLRAIQQGVTAKKRRRTVTLVAVGAALVFAALGIFILSGSDDFDARIGRARACIKSGDYDKAIQIINRLETEIADGDERSMTVANLRADAVRLIAGTRSVGSDIADELADAFRPAIERADVLFRAGNLSAGLEGLGEAAGILDGEIATRLQAKNATLHGKVRRDDFSELSQAAQSGINAVAERIQADDMFVEKLDRTELIREGLDLEKKLARLEALRRRSIDMDAVTKSVADLLETTGTKGGLEGALARLEDAYAHTRGTLEKAEQLEHVIRAQLLRPSITTTYRNSMTLARKDRDSGKLEEALATFKELLNFFRKVESLEPKAPYASLVSLIRAQGLWKQTDDARAEVEAMLEELARAKLHLEEGQYDEAQSLYISVLEAHPVVDFRSLIRLPLHITSRPSSAVVSVDDEIIGKTPLLLGLSYASTSEVRVTLSTFADEVIRVGGSENPGPAKRHVDLDKVPFWMVETGSPLGRCFALFGNLILAGGRDGIVHLLSAGAEPQATRLETKLIEGFSTAPGIDRKQAWLIATDGQMLRLGLSPEPTLEKVEARGEGQSGPVIAGHRITFVSADGHLRALENGVERWSTPLPGRVVDSPTLAGGRIFIGSITGAVTAISAATGQTLWTRDIGAPIRHSPQRSKDRILVGQDAGVVFALDSATGEVIWSHKIGSLVATRIVARFGIVHVGALDGRVYRLSEKNGNPVDYIEIGSSIETELTISDALLYVGTANGRACAFDLDTGSLLWSFDLGSAGVGTPLLLNDTVVFASRRGRIVAFQ
jgi:eukaryotic-like serine/threonine-protein kinase